MLILTCWQLLTKLQSLISTKYYTWKVNLFDSVNSLQTARLLSKTVFSKGVLKCIFDAWCTPLKTAVGRFAFLWVVWFGVGPLKLQDLLYLTTLHECTRQTTHCGFPLASKKRRLSDSYKYKKQWVWSACIAFQRLDWLMRTFDSQLVNQRVRKYTCWDSPLQNPQLSQTWLRMHEAIVVYRMLVRNRVDVAHPRSTISSLLPFYHPVKEASI